MRGPTRAQVLAGVLTLAALPLVALGAESLGTGSLPLAAVTFSALVFALLVPRRPRTARDLDAADLPLIAGAVLLPILAIAPLAAVARLVTTMVRRQPADRVMRVTARSVLASGAASLLYAAVADRGPAGPGTAIVAASLAASLYVAVDVLVRWAVRSVHPNALVLSWLLLPSALVQQLEWALAIAMTIEVLRLEPLFLVPAVPLFTAAYVQTRRRAATERRAVVLQTLVEVSHALGASLDPTEVFRAVYATVRRSLEVDAFFVAIAEPDGVSLNFRFRVDGGTELEPKTRPKAGTLSARCIDQGRPLLLRDAEREGRAIGVERSPWGSVVERSIMIAPLRIRGSVIGALSAQSVNEDAYDERDLELLGAIATEAAVAIERADLYDHSAALSRRLVDIHRTGLEMSGERDLAGIVRRLADSMRELLGSSAVVIYLEHDGPALEFAFRSGPSETDVQRLPKDLPLTARAIAEGPIAIVDSAEAPPDSRRMIEASGHRAVLVYPLRAASALVGIAFVTWKEPHEVTQDERELVDILAGLGASAIRSVRLYAELDDAYLATVQTLMTTIQARDGYHDDHGMRVAADAVELGERAGLAPASLRDLRYAALFHSLGKIGVPQSILAKPSALTAEEQRIVHEHPILGARILESIRFLRGVVPIVRHANERWDGSGYPDGLAYEAIPYEARILQIALSYETMLADRPYRRGFAPPLALAELRLLAGSRYDPGLVEQFVRIVEARGAIAAAQEAATDGASELSVLAEITPQFNTLLDLKQLLDGVLASLARHWPGCRPVILLRDEHTEELVVRAVAGDTGATVPGLRLARGRGLSSEVLERGEAVLIDDAQTDPRYVGAGDVRAVMMAPLLNEGRGIGVLSVSGYHVAAFARRDLTLLQAVAAQIAAAIEVASLHERLQRAANTDALTGLHNYRYFYDRLDEELARAQRRGSDVAVAYFDIDGLKRVNDTHGHIAGDAVLRTLGASIERHLRQEDVPARYGGDEFAVVMPDTSRAEAERVMTRLMELLDETPIELSTGGPVPMPPRSWGVAVFPDDGPSAQDLVQQADSRAYASKRAKA